MISAAIALQSVVLIGGTVHTMVPGEKPRPAQVLIHRGRIEALAAPGEALPPIRDPFGDLVEPEPVDISGQHVFPGLIDGMVNHDADHDALYVASGITLVRDQANQLSRVLAAKTSAARNAALGPDLLISGEVLDGDPPITTAAVVITSVQEAEDKIPRYLEQGVDYLSFYQGLGRSRQGARQDGDHEAVLKRVAELAHEGGVQLWGPRLPGLDMGSATILGQDGLFYLDGVLPEGTTWNSLENESLEAIADNLPRNLALTPAMRLYSHRIQDPGANPPELSVLGPHYTFQWMQELDLRRNLGWEKYVASGARVVALQRELLGRLAKAGQPLVPGSGAPNPWILPGIGLHDELADWERAGIERTTILEAATSGAARLLGVDDQRGTIAPGKIADVIVVPGDPRKNLDVLRAPEAVVLRGRLLLRKELDQLVDALVSRIDKIKVEADVPIAVPELELPEGEVVLEGMVENRAHGQRLSAERYAVVRHADGSLTYIGRLVTPGTATYSETLLDSSQHLVENRLEDFEVAIRFGDKDEYKLAGTRLGGNMRMRQSAVIGGHSAGGQNTSVRQEVAFLDLGSVTSHLILAKHQPPGRFFVLYLENLDPIVGNWAMQPLGPFHYVIHTSQGAANLKVDERGVPVAVRRVQGTTIVETTTLQASPAAGPGLAPPRREAKQVEEASASDQR